MVIFHSYVNGCQRVRIIPVSLIKIKSVELVAQNQWTYGMSMNILNTYPMKNGSWPKNTVDLSGHNELFVDQSTFG